MVYEYSTRRVYSTSSPRPVISTSYSYSPAGPMPVVTKLRQHPHLVLAYSPGTGKGHVINPLAIPHIAHKRLVTVSPPRRSRNGQNFYEALESGIPGNYGNRIILINYRPSPPPPPTKVVYIEDVTDPNSTTRLLRRERSPSPFQSMMYGSPYGSPWDISTPAGLVSIPRPMFSLYNIPLRSASEVKEVADLRRLYVRDRNPDVGYNPLNKALIYRMPLPHYVDPTIPQNYYIGRGNLACLSFAGGRPISKRRRFYPDYDDKIRDDVIFRSFYTKLRDAANRSAGKRPIYQPIYYSRKTILGEENVPKREPKESKWVERALANEKPPKPKAVATETVVAPPRKQSMTKERQKSPVQPVNVVLPGPRKSITEIIPEHKPRIENLPEEKVTVKIPPKEATPPPPKEPTPPPPKEPTPPPPPPPKEATPPPPKEPTPPPPKEATPPPPKEPTPPPPKEPTPPPPKEPTPPPPKEATPPPPPREPTPPPPQEAAPAVEEAPAPVEAAAPSGPVPAETGSSEISEASAPAASASASAGATGDEASNKGEVEDIQLDEEITLDEVCDVEENDLEIESDDPETNESAEPVQSPQETEGPAKVESEPVVLEPSSEASTPAPPANENNEAAPISIVVADCDGPISIEGNEEEATAQQEPLTVEEIQANCERRREEFIKLLEEHKEAVEEVSKLERVAAIVTRSCEEAMKNQENK